MTRQAMHHGYEHRPSSIRYEHGVRSSLATFEAWIIDYEAAATVGITGNVTRRGGQLLYQTLAL
jgi:hypothetical protein